jgi:pimeloyl-ACP methyl ester carboxylesterase
VAARLITGLAAIYLACALPSEAIAGASDAMKQATAQVSERPAQTNRNPPQRSVATAPTAEAEQPAPIVPRGRAYVFRGALGPFFSTGMDRLTEKIQRAGITATTYEFTLCELVASWAADDYKKDPQPIILIGHSMGGRCAVLFSEKLKDKGIPVSLAISIDPAHMTPDVPDNVERYINIFISTQILGGGDIKAIRGFPGHYASYDMAQHDEISHITIDKMDLVHQQIVAKILQLSATPAKVDGEIFPLRYVVPPNEQIELWDSGTAIAARSGDTLKTLAQQYGLPLWSLTQINKQLAENAPLADGQRVIVPRHLLPVADIAEPNSASR